MPITLKQIAEKAQVTPRVVSAVVNNDFSRVRVGKEKQERIRHLIRELNYAPNAAARNLVKKETRVVNMVVSTARFFETTFNARFASGLQSYLLEHNYHLHFTNLETGFTPSTGGLQRPDADAVILFYYGGDLNLWLIRQYQEFELPVLTVRGRCEEPDIANLFIDLRNAQYQLVKKLADLGHTRITHVESYLSDISHRDGAAGMQQAIQETGVTGFTRVKPEFDSQNPDAAGRAAEIGRNGLALALQQPERPTAIIFNHDLAALAAIDMARTMGIRVPDDLSICGNGNDPVGRVFQNPSLTTTEGKARQAGARAGGLIIKMISDPKFIPHEAIPVEPILRKSIRRV